MPSIVISEEGFIALTTLVIFYYVLYNLIYYVTYGVLEILLVPKALGLSGFRHCKPR
jgi:hypothetical protein